MRPTPDARPRAGLTPTPDAGGAGRCRIASRQTLARQVAEAAARIQVEATLNQRFHIYIGELCVVGSPAVRKLNGCRRASGAEGSIDTGISGSARVSAPEGRALAAPQASPPGRGKMPYRTIQGKNRSFLAKFDGWRGPNEYHKRGDGRESSRFQPYCEKPDCKNVSGRAGSLKCPRRIRSQVGGAALWRYTHMV